MTKAMNHGHGLGLGFACFALVVAMAGATQFKVGGNNGWSVPGANAESYNTWAERTRFQIGDSLVFVYPKDRDSVLLVEPADYNSCNTSSYVRKFDDGNTVFTFDRSGAFFFISGVEASCRGNEKLIVMVLASRNGTGGAPAPASGAPPPSSPPPSSASSPPPATSPSLPPAPAPKAPTSVPPAPAPATPSTPPPASSPPASAPSTAPSTPPSASPPPAPAPASPPSSGASAPSGSPPAPPSANAPSSGAANPAATSPPPAGPNNGAGLTAAAGLVSSAGAFIIGYAMLAL